MASETFVAAAGWKGFSMTPTPPAPETGTALDSGEISAVNAVGGAEVENHVRMLYPYQCFKFVGGVRSALSSVTGSVYGYGMDDETSTGREYLHLWNFTTSEWEELGHNAALENTLLSGTKASGASDYMSAAGLIYTCAVGGYTTHDDCEGYLHTDHASVSISYIPAPDCGEGVMWGCDF